MRKWALTLALVPLWLLACDRQPVAPELPSISARAEPPDCPTCYAYAHGSKYGSRLLYAAGAARGGESSVPSSTPLPAGLAVCMSMTTGPWVGVTDWDTLPGAIQNPEVIGCDRLLRPGVSYVIDYDAANAAAFSDVVSRLTNGIDDQALLGFFAVDEWLAVIKVLGGRGVGEHLAGQRPPGSTAHFVGPDFVGFTVDFMRLRVSNIQVGLETRNGNLYLSYSLYASWEYWGRNAPQN